MRKKWRFLRGGHSEVFALAMTFVLATGCFVACEPARAADTAKYEVFTLQHISVEQGKAFLADIVTGTVTHIPGTPGLLVTAKPDELAKARAVIRLVDSQEKYAIKALIPASAVRNMPSNDQIAAKLSPSLTRGISIGSFSAPPAKEAGTKAIIDIHNDSVVAVAPLGLLDRIAFVVAQFQDLKKADVREEPVVRTTPQASAKPTIPERNEPSEAKFIFAANGEVDTEPNIVTNTPGQAPETTASGQDYELPPLPNGEETVNLALADLEKLSLIEFLGLVGPYLQLDFMYDPRQLVGDVTINPNGKWRGPVKVKDLYPLLESVLQFKGFVMTRGKGNLVTIVPEADAFNIDPALLDSDKVKIERGDGIVTRIFKLEHIDVASAQNLLTGMRLTTNITPITETKTLIVTGYAYRMPRIQALLDIIDKPGKPKKFRFRQLQYTMAQTLAPKLQTLAEQLGTVSITVTETSTTSTQPTTSPQRPNETEAQYQARLRAEAAARARQRAAAARTPTTQQPEPATPTVYLDADDRTNRILMIGLTEQLDEVEELIDTLDVAQQDLRTLESYKIEHVDAEDVRKKLAELGIISERLTSPYSSRITDPTKPVPGTTTTTTRTTTAASRSRSMGMRGDEMSETPLEEPQVVVIEPTNSLLVNATAEQHEQIVKILKYADAETDRTEIPYKVYPLENQSPEHLVSVLEPLIQESVLDKEGKVESVRQKQEDLITIVPDPNTFSLVVYASKKNQEWIQTLVEQLDQRRPQVLIDVTLVQISKTDAFNYDLNLISSFPDLTSTSGLTSAIIPGAEGGNLVSGLMDSGRDRFVDFQSNGGNGTGFYGDQHINALLTMMQQKDYGRVLAKPKILVNDNEAGTISTIDRTYVTKTSSIPVGGGGAGQNTTLIQTAVDYADYPAGITLEIVPHISRGDFLRLDITLDRSDFGTITGDKPPDTTESNIKTTVTVPDQSTIILGGLLKLNQSKGGTKVPILGDLPLVGGLFRSASNSDIQRNLYVFVKAEIIKPESIGVAQGGLNSISERHRNAFEKHETEFQEYNDWPGITPKNMDPLKVLDAQ